jgi:alpha-galactosidase
MMTLWSIFRSPLMFGGDLPSNDPATLALITNPEVLAVDQFSTGGHQAYRTADTIAWVADRPVDTPSKDPARAPRYVALDFTDLGIPIQRAAMRDLWSHTDLGPSDRLTVQLAPHASALYLLTPIPAARK